MKLIGVAAVVVAVAVLASTARAEEWAVVGKAGGRPCRGRVKLMENQDGSHLLTLRLWFDEARSEWEVLGFQGSFDGTEFVGTHEPARGLVGALGGEAAKGRTLRMRFTKTDDGLAWAFRVLDVAKSALVATGTSRPVATPLPATFVHGDGTPIDPEDVARRFARRRGRPFIQGAGDSRAIHPNDVVQGAVGDCYLLAALCAVAKTRPEIIEQRVRDVAEGAWEVRLHDRSGRERWWPVDDRFAVNDQGRLVNARPGDTEEVDGQVVHELWPMLFEEAFAAMSDASTNGGQMQLIDGGPLKRAFAALDLVVRDGDLVWFDDDAEAAARRVAEAHRAGSPVAFGVAVASDRLATVGGHAYALASVSEAADGTLRFQLRNPWGNKDPVPLTAEELASVGAHAAIASDPPFGPR